MTVLHPGSWKAFNEWSDKGVFIPEEISDDIFLILKKEQQQAICEQIKDQYISGFKKENRWSWPPGVCKEILEREETQIHCSDCHPGRFFLNPDEGVRAVGGNPALLCGGYVMSSRKHRKLSSSEIVKHNVHASGPDCAPGRHDILIVRNRIEGFQDVYFLGGLPLMYWSFGGQMGMKLLAEFTQPHRMMWMWRGTEDAVRYQLTDGLSTFDEARFLPPTPPPPCRARARYTNDIDIWVYAEYLMKQEQNMIEGKYTFT